MKRKGIVSVMFLVIIGILAMMTACGGGNDDNDTIASAGVDQNVVSGTLVTLDGSASQGDGELVFAWSFASIPSGSAAALSNPAAVKPTFIADVDGEYVVDLTVTANGDSDTDSVTVTAATVNSVPVADAGVDQNVATGSTVTLDGSASSDANGDLLTYDWSITSKPAGSNAALSDSNTVKPTFVADTDGAYLFSLVVNDGSVNSAPDNVTVTAATANSVPVAEAGPDQNVATGSAVTLDGSASSDADGDPLSYSWRLIAKPTGSAAVLSNPDIVKPSFTPDLDGDYLFSLVVNDGMVSSSADNVTIKASTVNSVPVANAGPDQYVTIGSTVTLDGSASSDADGDPLSYSWSLTAKPAGSTAVLTGADTVSPTFTVDINGDYLISLVVHDGIASSAIDTVVVTTTPPVFAFAVRHIQYRTFELANPLYRYFFAMTKNGVPIDPAHDVTGLRVLDSANNVIATMNGVSIERYLSYNCLVQPCVQNPTEENGFYGNLGTLAPDTYSFEVDTVDGQTLRLDVPYPGQLALPVVSSSSMQSAWNALELVLSWSNPVNEPNWDRVDQLRVRIYDGTGAPVLSVWLNPAVESVTLPFEVIDNTLWNYGIPETWEVQTRTYDVNNMNFARGYSNKIIISP